MALALPERRKESDRKPPKKSILKKPDVSTLLLADTAGGAGASTARAHVHFPLDTDARSLLPPPSTDIDIELINRMSRNDAPGHFTKGKVAHVSYKAFPYFAFTSPTGKGGIYSTAELFDYNPALPVDRQISQHTCDKAGETDLEDEIATMNVESLADGGYALTWSPRKFRSTIKEAWYVVEVKYYQLKPDTKGNFCIFKQGQSKHFWIALPDTYHVTDPVIKPPSKIVLIDDVDTIRDNIAHCYRLFFQAELTAIADNQLSALETPAALVAAQNNPDDFFDDGDDDSSDAHDEDTESDTGSDVGSLLSRFTDSLPATPLSTTGASEELKPLTIMHAARRITLSPRSSPLGSVGALPLNITTHSLPPGHDHTSLTPRLTTEAAGTSTAAIPIPKRRPPPASAPCIFSDAAAAGAGAPPMPYSFSAPTTPTLSAVVFGIPKSLRVAKTTVYSPGSQVAKSGV